jgi:hypothetical protein
MTDLDLVTCCTKNAPTPRAPGQAAPPSGRGPVTPQTNSRPRRLTLACLAAPALLALGCAGAGDGPEEPVGRVEQAIEGGSPLKGHPEVVRLTWVSGDQASSCTGIIIAPDLVLTARHCVSSFEEPKKQCRDGEEAGAKGELSVAVRTTEGVDTLPVEEGSVLVPDDEDGEPHCEADIALVRAPGLLGYRNERWFWVASPRLDSALAPGETYSALGYGSTSGDGTGGGELRRRDGLRVSCLGVGCEATTGALPQEWEGDAGVCEGDSGGPAIDADDRVVGIASRSYDADCGSPVYVSVFAWRWWLQRVALESADLASYRNPPWALRVADEGEGEGANALTIGGGACSLGPAGAGGPGAFAFPALALGCAALGARRRARRRG